MDVEPRECWPDRSPWRPPPRKPPSSGRSRSERRWPIDNGRPRICARQLMRLRVLVEAASVGPILYLFHSIDNGCRLQG